MHLSKATEVKREDGDALLGKGCVHVGIAPGVFGYAVEGGLTRRMGVGLGY
jgi:hypothetical protein